MAIKAEVLRKLLDERTAEAVDWPKRRQVWLRQIAALYAQVEAWLEPYIKSGQVTVERVPQTLEEEGLGRYEVEALRIRLVDLEAWLEPVAALVIAARGRVDLRGFRGGSRLVLVPSDVSTPRALAARHEDKADTAPPDSDDVWKLASPPPDVRYTPLDEDAFLGALMQAVNGDPHD